jgi:tRNA (guanine-N7-)-methyltransferase
MAGMSKSSEAMGRRAAAAGVLLDPGEAKREAPFDFAEMFGNPRPVELEIGAGKGTFLVARARARPGLNFLGVEWARKYCHHGADRAGRWGLTNVRMIRADAELLVKRRVPDASLLRAHIYFPDPWPKRKHVRRRLIQPPFVDLLRRKLMIGGVLAVVTDHTEYARQIAWVLDQQPGLARVSFPRTHSAADGEIVGTNFERKYIAQGRRFFARAVIRLR